jgi:hypothetical protein
MQCKCYVTVFYHIVQGIMKRKVISTDMIKYFQSLIG